MNNVLELKAVAKFVDTCNQSWLKGWNERNGGNMSYRMKDCEVDTIKHLFHDDGAWKSIGITVENLANEYFTVTGSGKFYMNVKNEPENNICIVKIDEKGEKAYTNAYFTDDFIN